MSVMIFKSEKALKYLLERGVVYTVRPQRRKREGRVWITNRRGGRKIANGYAILVAEIASFSELEKYLPAYVKHSGFSSIAEWIDEIKKLNSKLPEKFWIYLVTRIYSPSEVM